MKKVFISMVIFAVLFLVGCNQNSSNNPVAPLGINAVNKTSNNIKTGTIKIDRILELPGLGNTYYQINGMINYKEELLTQNLSPSTAKPDVNVDIAIDATLSNSNLINKQNVAPDVNANTDNLIYVSEEGIYLLKKTYPVEGLKDNVDLVCTYLITTDNVSLNKMELTARSIVH